MATEPAVITERRGSVGLITFNEPKTLNALSPAMKAGLIAAVADFVPDPAVRAILITANGRAFCAGGDIRSMDERGAVYMRRRMQSSHEWLARLLKTEKPVVTAVNGVAAGAGFSLALVGDIVCAATDAKFKAGFPGIGAVPDLALAQVLPRAVGILRAKEIILTNREMPAQEAHALGMVARLYAPDRLLPECLALAEQLADGPTVAYGLAKHLMSRAFDTETDTFLDLEASAQATAFGSADFDEGVRAFKDKRKPRFRGQ